MNIELKIEGMSCGHCARAVREALENVEGVQAARVDLAAKRAVVDAEASVTPERLISVVTEEGYAASLA
jgi:copper chaperone